MDNQTRLFIRDLARESRVWVEQLNAWDHDYRDDPKDWVVDTSGYCAIASADLHQRLKDADCYAQIAMSNGYLGSHVFVLFDDHIIDITADQFSEFRERPLVFEHQRLLADSQWHSIDEIFDTVAALKRYQRKTGWPAHQTVRRRPIDL